MTAKKHTEEIKENKYSIFEWVIELRNKYGILNILTAGMLMVFMSITLLFSLNPSIIFDKYREYDEQKHTESFNYRMRSQKAVQLLLKELMGEVHSTRCFVIELHNGKTNAAGLSFNYGSLTYECLNDTTESIMEDYSDFSLERFPITAYLYENGFWCGTTEELRSVDKKLAVRLESNGTYGIAFTTIYGIKNEIGFLGISFDRNKSGCDRNFVSNKIRKYANELSPLLDGENAK